MPPRFKFWRALAPVALAAAWISAARAAEVVTLRSGFTVACASREPMADGTVRLHLRGADPDRNFMDVPAASIVGTETVPDEPVPVAATRPAAEASPAIDTAALLSTSGAAHNVNAALLASVVKAESGGNPRAVSRTGARGLMQLMPGTAAELGVADSFSPEGNVNGGSAYLDRLLTRYHDNLPLALAAYNAGPAAVDRYHGIPPYRETRAYVARVIREFNRRVLQEEKLAATTGRHVLSAGVVASSAGTGR